jgi:hypothetical protein
MAFRQVIHEQFAHFVWRQVLAGFLVAKHSFKPAFRPFESTAHFDVHVVSRHQNISGMWHNPLVKPTVRLRRPSAYRWR